MVDIIMERIQENTQGNMIVYMRYFELAVELAVKSESLCQ